MPGKIYKVTITMPDLAAAHAEQEAKVESNSWPTAVKLACEEISKRPHVLGKHIKSARIGFSVLENSAAPTKPKPRDERAETAQGCLFEL